MIWIQTGLALVIFSAALRGIPKETLEAAKIDGASEFKTFISIIIPYLGPTILVIWTIITIVVLKIFDIVLAMTNGQWQTEVLANLMFDWMFQRWWRLWQRKCFSNIYYDWCYTYNGTKYLQT